MREYLTPEREATAIRLRRSTFSGTFLLVEGSSDKIFYERFVDKTECTVITNSIPGKQRVIEVLLILENSKFQGILAIVDADFDHLETPLHIDLNLIRTDTHDLETMLLQSPALDKVLAEFGSEEKIAKFGRDIREALLEAGMLIGYLLWISQLDKLNLTFNGIVFSRFINEQTLQIDEAKFIQEVKNKSQAPSLNNEDLQQRIANQRSKSHNPWQVCCGHDLVEILSLGLRKAIGSAKPSDVEPYSLERNLRLAYEESYFCTMQICSYVRLWEKSNQPFKVLRNDL
ncbi:DUF4435 domain-containing protein [Desertifilum sp. FACHB-1129]|uniref:DUF4435 domain-containing protein n=2 Tax=Desertifilum tharense IPPAS B-1220 TaxID=1781255 RepID=A0A1E5QNT5_9CYAN|nr:MULTISPECIES: DUF4435 domain-containing protein [Desertifilum]MDA0212251.1 DUF4435 domain-containing protein [Cyanobacteria bacterium FC1]MBD2312831.1 DUF4435 domain-containing protein [Desertifilum sp. FACHB-1129]MBD2324195.1 DUF4435 domain-containing protein [Desertifilum sp. FACHB-866]MBD2334209.1 DUF4435 domain-containing protein [Desertifilum sp. FACHB-868]OEJ76274.1 hypothetical protein BH720_05405 [Desertifilum tharense IPPAS B-1220]